MSNAVAEFERIVTRLGGSGGVEVGQLFGKTCLKMNGKAFVAQHHETVAFKLTGNEREVAIALDGAALWDPSGKGRPMKEWIALPVAANKHFKEFAKAALAFVVASATKPAGKGAAPVKVKPDR